MKRDAQKDKENLKLLYSKYVDFDLEDSSNIGHTFYENYQKLNQIDSNDPQFRYLLFYCLFGVIEYLQGFSDETELKFWQKRLKNNSNSVGLYGDIFELYIQWTLIQKQIVFSKSERPDFIIEFNASNVYLECTSAQFDLNKMPTENEVFKKIKSVVRAKLTSGYLNSSTALFIDITNLVYHLENFDKELLRKALEAIDIDLKKNPSETLSYPGSVTFMNFEFVENKTHNFSCNITGNFIRNADANLVKFLESNFIPKIEKKKFINPKFNH